MLFWDVQETAPTAGRATLRGNAAFAIVLLSSTTAFAQQVLTQSVITQEALAEQPTLCQGDGYPAEWTWAPNQTRHPPGSATTGNPQIVQMRNGVAIATYTNLGGNGPNCTFKGDGTDWQNPGPP